MTNLEKLLNQHRQRLEGDLKAAETRELQAMNESVHWTQEKHLIRKNLDELLALIKERFGGPKEVDASGVYFLCGKEEE